jgi:hypothetical protein
MRCDCGLYEEDPAHLRWHELREWNLQVFADAKEKREKEFDELVKRSQPSVPDVPRGQDSLW